MRYPRWVALLLLVFSFQFLIGCTGKGGPDPWESTNREIYKFNDNLDRWILKPAADGYVKVVPKEIRTGVNNGFNNLGYLDVILNDFLQGKWEQGWRDSGRMAINTTIGVAGIFDFATPMGLPANDNDFGVTLGKWGVKQGPYIVLPVFGPSTTRDVASVPVGIVTNPLTYVQVEWWVSVPLDILKVLDKRAEIDRYIRLRDQNALDPYIFVRDAYLQNRENKVRDGRSAPEPGLYDDPEAGPSTHPALPPLPTTTAPAGADVTPPTTPAITPTTLPAPTIPLQP
jgi:phospholipid-binding lipoprotein MlaA